MAPPVVGFDLDMTLIDARDGIAAAYRALSGSTGVHVDIDTVVSRLGPPLRDELAHWFPADRVDEAVRRYRHFYERYAIEACRPMPGAPEAVAAARRYGGRVIVVTSKLGRFARAHLDHLGITVEVVVGNRFGDGKARAIRDHGAGIYVGDHVADVHAALAGGAVAVGVATGGCGPDELRDAGAHTVLADLHMFPEWLALDGAADGRHAAPDDTGSG